MTNPSSHPPPTRPPLQPPPPRRPFSPLRRPRPPTTIKHLRHRRRPSNGRPPARARRRNRGPTAPRPRATTTASCSARTTSKRARRNPGMIFSVVESFLDLLRSIIFPKPGHLIGLARLGQENQKKVSWKSFYKKMVKDYWNSQIRLKACERSSLKWLLLGLVPKLKPHGVWSSCHGRPYLVEAATTRARMLVGRYTCGDSPWLRESENLCKICW